MRALDHREADAPEPGAHDVHAEQPRQEPVDVARPWRLHVLLARRSTRPAAGRAPAARRPPPGALAGSPAASDRTGRSADRRARRRRGRRRCAARRPRSAGLDQPRHDTARRRRAPCHRPPAPRRRRARRPESAPAPAAGTRRRAPAPSAPGRRRPRTPPPARAGTRGSGPASAHERVRTGPSGRLASLDGSRSVCRHLRISQVPPGQRHEHVLERRAVGGQLGQRPALRARAAPSRAGTAWCSSDVVSRPCGPSLPHASSRRAAPAARRSTAPSPSSANSTTCSAPSDAISSRGVSERDDPAVIDDGHAVAQRLGFVHVVRREQHRAARLPEPLSSDHSCRRDCGSRPVVGSSRNSRSGLPTSAQATASRCFCPPESFPTQASRFDSRARRAAAPRRRSGRCDRRSGTGAASRRRSASR